MYLGLFFAVALDFAILLLLLCFPARYCAFLLLVVIFCGFFFSFSSPLLFSLSVEFSTLSLLEVFLVSGKDVKLGTFP